MSFKNFNYTGKYKIFSAHNDNIKKVGKFISKFMLDDIIQVYKKETEVTWRTYYIDIQIDERITDDNFELK